MARSRAAADLMVAMFRLYCFAKLHGCEQTSKAAENAKQSALRVAVSRPGVIAGRLIGNLSSSRLLGIRR